MPKSITISNLQQLARTRSTHHVGVSLIYSGGERFQTGLELYCTGVLNIHLMM